MRFSGLGHFIFSIDNHPLWIIEADGEYTKPALVNRLPVAIGQRYSVIVTADQPVSNYWIRATLEEGCLLTNDVTINVNSAINYTATGILRYDGATETLPTTTESTDVVQPCLGLPPNFLKLFYPRAVPTPVANTITLNFTLRPDPTDNVVHAFVNNSTYVPDFANPTLEKLVNGKVPVAQLPASENIYTLDVVNGVYDIYVLSKLFSQILFKMILINMNKLI
jgi:FtsP/CotA-like multicopper oxidase with cupredoxin domain